MSIRTLRHLPVGVVLFGALACTHPASEPPRLPAVELRPAPDAIPEPTATGPFAERHAIHAQPASIRKYPCTTGCPPPTR